MNVDIRLIERTGKVTRPERPDHEQQNRAEEEGALPMKEPCQLRLLSLSRRNYVRRLFLLPHLVAKRYHAARVRFHLHEVQTDIFVEPFEEWDPFTDQRGHDRIANFID